MKNYEVLVVGAGAVGVFFNAHLAKNDNVNVSVVCRSDYDIVKSQGYKIESPDGDIAFQPSKVFHDVSEYDNKADFIIVCTKVLPEINVAEIIREAVSPGTVIVLIQNGIDIEQEIAREYPENEIISGIAYVGVTRVAPGQIVHTDSGKLKFGVYPEGTSPMLNTLVELYNNGGIPTNAYSDILRVRWEKLVWNTPYNPVSVLTRSNTKQVMDSPEAVQLIQNIMNEVCTVAAAAGWKQRSGVVNDMLEYTRSFRPYKPSMLVDFENGRAMEIEAIIGNVVREADKFGIQVPHAQSVYSMIKLLEDSVKHN